MQIKTKNSSRTEALVNQLHWKAAQTGLEGFCKKDTAGWVRKGFDLGRVGEDEYDQNMYKLKTLKELMKKTRNYICATSK